MDFLDEYRNSMAPDQGIQQPEADAIKNDVEASLDQEAKANQKASLQAARDQMAQQKAAAAQQSQSIKEGGGIVVHDQTGAPTAATAPIPLGGLGTGSEPVAKTAHSNYVVGRNTGKVYSKDPGTGEYAEAPADNYVNPTTGAQFKSYGNGVFKQPVMDADGTQITDPAWATKKGHLATLGAYSNTQVQARNDLNLPDKREALKRAAADLEDSKSAVKDAESKDQKKIGDDGWEARDAARKQLVADAQAAKANARDALNDATDKAGNITTDLQNVAEHRKLVNRTGTLPPEIAKKYQDALTPDVGNYDNLPVNGEETPAPATPAQPEPATAPVTPGPLATPETVADLPIDQHAAVLKSSAATLQVKGQQIQQQQQEALAPLAPVDAKQQDWQNRSDMLLYGRIPFPDENRANIPILPNAQVESLQTLDGQTINFPKGMKQELRQLWDDRQQAQAKAAPQLAAVNQEWASYQGDLDAHDGAVDSLKQKLAVRSQQAEQSRQDTVAKVRASAPEAADRLDAIHNETQASLKDIDSKPWSDAAKQASRDELLKGQEPKLKEAMSMANPITRISKEQDLADDYRQIQQTKEDQDSSLEEGGGRPAPVDTSAQEAELAKKYNVDPKDLKATADRVQSRAYSVDADGKLQLSPYGADSNENGQALTDPTETSKALEQANKDGLIDPKTLPEVRAKLAEAKVEYDKVVKEAGDAAQVKAVLRGGGAGLMGAGGGALSAPIGAEIGADVGTLGGPLAPATVPIGAAVGGVVGGLVGFKGGTELYNKILKDLAPYSDLINSANQAVRLHPGYAEAGELASFLVAPTKIFSSAAWKQGTGTALKPAVVSSFQNYAKLAEVAADSAGKAGVDAATDALRQEASAKALFKAAGESALGAGLFTAVQAGVDWKLPTAQDVLTNVALAAVLHGQGLEFKNVSAPTLSSAVLRGLVREKAGIPLDSVDPAHDVAGAFKSAGIPVTDPEFLKPLSPEGIGLFNNAKPKIDELFKAGQTPVNMGGQQVTGRGVFGKRSALASNAEVVGEDLALPSGKVEPPVTGSAKALPAPRQAASDAEIEELEPSQAVRVNALRDLAQGKPIAELRKDELNSIGLDTQLGSDKLVPLKPVGEDGKAGLPATPDVHVDAAGNAIILQHAIDDVAKTAPATAEMIRPESEARKQFATKEEETPAPAAPLALPAPTQTREEAIKASTAKLHADLADAKDVSALGGENDKTGKDLISKAQREHKARVIEALKLPRGEVPTAKPIAPEVAPAPKPKDVLPEAPKVQEAIAEHGAGPVRVITDAVKAFEPVFSGVEYGETHGDSGAEYDPTSGRLHVDPVKLVDHLKKAGGGTVAGTKKELTRILFEEKEHRLSTLLDVDSNGNATPTTDPAFAKDLADMWGSVPDSNKKAQAIAYYKRAGVEFPSDWAAKHEWWSDVAAKLGRGELPAGLETPGLKAKIKKLISSYIRALERWLLKAPAEVKAAYVRTLAKLKGLEAKLKGEVEPAAAKVEEAKPEYPELRKTYSIPEDAPNHPSFSNIARRAEGRAERDKGPFGKFGQMARESFSGPQGALTPLASHPVLREALGLPMMPTGAGKTDAMQHTMDALAEKAGVARSSVAPEDLHRRIINTVADVVNSDTDLDHTVATTVAATEEIHRKIGALFNDNAVKKTVTSAQDEVAAGALSLRTEAILKGALVRKAKELNITKGPDTPNGKDLSEISTRYAIPRFIEDVKAGRLLEGAIPADWLGRRYAEHEAVAGRSLPYPHGQRDSGLYPAAAREEARQPEVDESMGMGFDPTAEGYVVPGAKKEANQARRVEIIANKKLAAEPISDNKEGMSYPPPPPYTPPAEAIVPKEQTSDEMLQPKKGISRAHLIHLEALQRAEDNKERAKQIEDPRARMAEGAQALRDKKDAMGRITRLPKTVADLKRSYTFNQVEKMYREGDITGNLFNQFVDDWNGNHFEEQHKTQHTDDEFEFPRAKEELSTPAQVVSEVKKAISDHLFELPPRKRSLVGMRDVIREKLGELEREIDGFGSNELREGKWEATETNIDRLQKLLSKVESALAGPETVAANDRAVANKATLPSAKPTPNPQDGPAPKMTYPIMEGGHISQSEGREARIQNPKPTKKALENQNTRAELKAQGVGSVAKKKVKEAEAANVVTPEPASTKEPWQMTKEEAVADIRKTLHERQAEAQRGGEPYKSNWRGKRSDGWLTEAHELHIADALREGKPVPAEVLADYPGLKERVEAEEKWKKDREKEIPLAGSPEAKAMFDKENMDKAMGRKAHILAQGFVKKGDEWVHPDYPGEGIYSNEVPSSKVADVERELEKLKGESSNREGVAKEPQEPPNLATAPADDEWDRLAAALPKPSPLAPELSSLYPDLVKGSSTSFVPIHDTWEAYLKANPQATKAEFVAKMADAYRNGSIHVEPMEYNQDLTSEQWSTLIPQKAGAPAAFWKPAERSSSKPTEYHRLEDFQKDMEAKYGHEMGTAGFINSLNEGERRSLRELQDQPVRNWMDDLDRDHPNWADLPELESHRLMDEYRRKFANPKATPQELRTIRLRDAEALVKEVEENLDERDPEWRTQPDKLENRDLMESYLTAREELMMAGGKGALKAIEPARLGAAPADRKEITELARELGSPNGTEADVKALSKVVKDQLKEIFGLEPTASAKDIHNASRRFRANAASKNQFAEEDAMFARQAEERKAENAKFYQEAVAGGHMKIAEDMAKKAAFNNNHENWQNVAAVEKDAAGRVKSLEERFPMRLGSKSAVAPEEDAAYMKAAESGDTEMAQRMVDHFKPSGVTEAPKIGRHGGWIDPKGEIHPVEATYGHADVAEERTGIPIKTPDDYNKVYEKGLARLVNSSDGIFVTFGDKKLNRAQVATLENLGISKNKPVYIDRGGRGYETLVGERLGAAPAGASSVPAPGRAPDPIDAAIKELQIPSNPALRAVIKDYLKTGSPNFTKNVVAQGATPANAARAQTILNHARGPAGAGAGAGAGAAPPNPPPPRPAPTVPPTAFGKIYTAAHNAIGKAQAAKTVAQHALNAQIEAFKKAVPNSSVRAAITIYNQANGNTGTLNAWKGITAKNSIGITTRPLLGFATRAQALTPEELQWAARVKPHTAIDPTSIRSLFKKPFTPTGQDELAKQERNGSIKTYADGFLAGFKPKQLDAADLLNASGARQIKADQRDATATNMKQATAGSGEPLVVPMSKIDNRYSASEHLPGYAVHKSIEDKVNSVFGSSSLKDWRESDSQSGKAEFAKRVADTTIGMNNLIRSGNFLWSPFHIINLRGHAYGYGNPLQGLAATFGKVTKFDPTNPDHLDAIQHGLSIGHSSHKSATDVLTGLSSPGGLLSGAAKQLGLGGLAGTLEHYSLAKKLTDATAHTVDGLKLKIYPQLLKANLAASAKEISAGTKTLGDVKFETTQQLNAGFGHLNYEMIGRSMTARDVASFLGLSADFFETRIRGTVAAVGGAVGAGAKFLPGKAGEVAQQLYSGNIGQTKNWLSIALGGYVAAAAINALLNDGDPKLNHPFQVVPKGWNRGITIRSTVTDALGAYNHPGGFIPSHLGPITSASYAAASGHNWRDDKVTPADAIKEMVGRSVPMALQGVPAVKDTFFPQEKRTTGESIVNGLGVEIKPFTDVKPAYDLVDAFRKSIGAKEKPAFPPGPFGVLKDRLEGNNLPAAKEEITKLQKTGLTDAKIIDSLNKSIFHPWVDAAEAKPFEAFLAKNNGMADMKRAEAAREAMWSRFQSLVGGAKGKTVTTVPQLRGKAAAQAAPAYKVNRMSTFADKIRAVGLKSS